MATDMKPIDMKPIDIRPIEMKPAAKPVADSKVNPAPVASGRGMSRETKLALVVAASFAVLVGGILGVKYLGFSAEVAAMPELPINPRDIQVDLSGLQSAAPSHDLAPNPVKDSSLQMLPPSGGAAPELPKLVKYEFKAPEPDKTLAVIKPSSDMLVKNDPPATLSIPEMNPKTLPSIPEATPKTLPTIPEATPKTLPAIPEATPKTFPSIPEANSKTLPPLETGSLPAPGAEGSHKLPPIGASGNLTMPAMEKSIDNPMALPKATVRSPEPTKEELDQSFGKLPEQIDPNHLRIDPKFQPVGHQEPAKPNEPLVVPTPKIETGTKTDAPVKVPDLNMPPELKTLAPEKSGTDKKELSPKLPPIEANPAANKLPEPGGNGLITLDPPPIPNKKLGEPESGTATATPILKGSVPPIKPMELDSNDLKLGPIGSDSPKTAEPKSPPLETPKLDMNLSVPGNNGTAPNPVKPTNLAPPAEQPRVITIPAMTMENKQPGTIPLSTAVNTKSRDYDEDLHYVKQGDDFKTISKKYYDTDTYAKALYDYNQAQPNSNKGVVRVPPIWVLEKNHTNAIPVSNSVRTASLTNEPRPIQPPPPSVEPSDVPVNAPFKDLKVYTVQGNGETLRDIARRVLGNENAWKTIKDYNISVNETAELAVGTKLYMPPQR